VPIFIGRDAPFSTTIFLIVFGRVRIKLGTIGLLA